MQARTTIRQQLWSPNAGAGSNPGVSLARCLLAVLLIFTFSITATADVRDQVYSFGQAPRNIYQVGSTGTVSSIFTNYAGTDTAGAAQRASDGMIFFVTQVANGQVYRWNPSTPATAPVLLGTTGATIPYFPRFAFSASSVLYAVDTDSTNLYMINQTTGAATSVAALSGVPTNLGGDIGFGPDGILYMVADTTIYTVPLGGGAVTSLGTISGLAAGAGAIVGMTFDFNGNMLVEDDQTPAQLYTVALPSRVATKFAGTMTSTQGDLAAAPRVKITGTVFEDVNYGGGAGRSLASGIGRANVRVELYDSAGAFITSTTTNGSGVYTLTGAAGQTYTIRVVDSSVTSSRPGAVGTLVGVQTFRTSGLTGTVGTPDANRVGGEDPTKIDAGNGSTTLAALTAGANTPQSITSVALGTGSITGIDFGFNFDTIVSTRDSGQGTLRQFIINSNSLTNTGLAQVGETSGVEASIFMIPNGAAVDGLRASLMNQLSSGVAQIVPATQLPAITDSNTLIDGTEQTTNVGDTNSGTQGVGGTVGVDGIALPTVNKPEVQISAAQGTIPIGIDINAINTTVRGLAIYGFGTGPNTNGSANIEIETGITGALIEKNFIGSTATSFADPGAATRSIGDDIRSVGGRSGTIQNNLIGFSQGKGMGIESASTGWTVQHNEVRLNGINNPNLDGIDVENSSSITIQQNLFAGNTGPGIDSYQSTGSNTIVNNTVTGNGLGTGAALEDMGIRIFGTGNTVDRNVISNNVGSGIVVTSGAATTLITKNSIFGNGAGNHGIGIDLQSASDNQLLGTAPFVTLNDLNDADTGGNGLLNYPILQSATVSGVQLTITGFARPGSSIELFVAAADPSGFGQGKTYVVTLVEGSAGDLDSGTGTYGPGTINGIPQGTDTTNKFTFAIPLPSGITAGTVLTATATLSGATSEFSGNVTVGVGTSITGKVYVDANHNRILDSAEDWTSGVSVFVNLVKAGAVSQSVAVAAGAGTFTFSNVGSGAYSIVVTNTATSVTPVAPPGFAFVIPTQGTLQINVVNDSFTNQNFGLFHGSLVSGVVFKDNGAGGGTANNGVPDGAEAGLAGVTVRATDGAATTFDTALTGSDGTYTLFITPGATTVAVIKTSPTGYIATGAQVGNTPTGVYNRVTDTVSFTKGVEGFYTGVNFGVVALNTFQADQSQQSLPGSILLFGHIFVPGTSGQVTFTFSSTTNPANVPFSTVLYQDSNCNGSIDPGEPAIIGALNTTAGANLCVILKVTIPPGTPFNSSDNSIITANFGYTNASPALTATYSVRDLTTVGTPTNAGLRLEKTVDKATALPATNLTYTLTFTNDSSAPLSTLKINDSTPAYTTFVSAACGSPLPSSLTGCSFTAPNAGQAGNIQWVFTGTLSPSQTGTVTFVVKIE